LRGRSGRQGDPGQSFFFLSLEDNLMRLFGSERIAKIMDKSGAEEGEVLTHPLVTRAIESAQKRVELQNFQARKRLLEYDDVMNQQREVIYTQRREILSGEDQQTTLQEWIAEMAEGIAETFADERTRPEEWELQGLGEAVFKQFNFTLRPPDADTLDGLNREGLAQFVGEAARTVYAQKEARIGSQEMRHLERIVMLQTVDSLWKDHLLSMDHLKEGIGLRGYAQQDPLLIYKKEGFEMFQDMIDRIKQETVSILYRIQITEPERIEDLRAPKEQNLVFSGGGDSPQKKKPVRRQAEKVGRNAPCPCGSGKKYKKCCGK
jgi:preprotein translocase subunit SecA